MSNKILYANGPGSRKFQTIIKVAGLNVTVEDIEFGVDNETEAWKLNCSPTNRAPVMQLAEGGYLFESHAIVRHLLRLAEKNGKPLYGKNVVEASQVDQWIEYTVHEINGNMTPILYNVLGYANHPEDVLEQKYEGLHWAMNGLESWLETRTFLVGERLSGADILLAVSLEFVLSALPKSFDFWKYKNAVRFYMTVFYANPGFAEGQKLTGGNGFPVAKPEAPKKEAPKKAEAPKKEAAAKPDGNDDDDGADEVVDTAPKKTNPLDLLPPSKLVLDAWKREYSNNKDTRNGSSKWLFENFDKEGYTMWFCKYKYNNELTKVFMTSNLVRGWFQRMEGVRKYAFGVALTLGTEESHEIQGFWLFRGTGKELPECVKEVEDTNLMDWRLADLETEKELITDFLCWEGKALGKPCLEGRAFK